MLHHRPSRPFSVTTEHSRHLVLDAGHIAIESDLAAKDARHELDEKLKQSYDLEDYKRLEAHMYDRFSLKFEAAQVSAFRTCPWDIPDSI